MDARLTQIIGANRVVVFTRTKCPFCLRAKELLRSLGASFDEHDIDVVADDAKIFEEIQKQFSHETVPAIFIGGKFYGGCSDITALHEKGELKPLLGL
jgi:glutaredoxin 3